MTIVLHGFRDVLSSAAAWTEMVQKNRGRASAAKRARLCHVLSHDNATMHNGKRRETGSA